MRLIPEVNDYITVVEWTNHKDNSYKGDVLKVKVVDLPFIRVKNLNSTIKSITLNLNQVIIKELSSEFVADALESTRD